LLVDVCTKLLHEEAQSIKATELSSHNQGRKSVPIFSVDIYAKLFHEVSKHVETYVVRCATHEIFCTPQWDAFLIPSPKLGHIAPNARCENHFF
jgi:hypothetical protein